MRESVLILDNRKEQSLKNKRTLENIGIDVFLSTDVNATNRLLLEIEPDLVIISDGISDTPQEIIEKIRSYRFNTRPVIIVLSKSNHTDDRINILNAGADDFVSEPISSKEFIARVQAHLRRLFDSEMDETTQLYNQKISFKFLKRTINTKKSWAAMLIGINKFESYRELYGNLAADKMKQTLGVIAKTALDNDFVGMTSDGEFLALTTPAKAEKVAKILVDSFNAVAKKFYSQEDAEQGFITLNGDDIPERKINLVSISIGIISNENHKITGFKQALHTLLYVKKLAEENKTSSYVFDRPKLTAVNSVETKYYNAKLLIFEPDFALSFLLESEAKIRGYEVQTVSSIKQLDENFIPSVIILDAGNIREMQGIQICRNLKNNAKYKNSNIIMTTVVHDKQSILSSGADLYLPKPYEIPFMFEWVERLMNKYNN